jgi:hypothetical protein
MASISQRICMDKGGGAKTVKQIHFLAVFFDSE